MPLVVQIPDRAVSQSQPIVWKVTLPASPLTTTYVYLTRMVVIPFINGVEYAPIQPAIKIDGFTGDAYVEVDTQGLVRSYFTQTHTKTDTIPGYDKEKAFSFYFTGNGNAHCAMFLQTKVYFDDGTGEQEDLGLQKETIEVFPLILNVQEQESQRFAPYLFGAGQEFLSYQQFVNAGVGTGVLPPQRGGLVLRNKGMGYFLSMLWSGGAAAAALTFVLRNSVTQNWYGTGTVHLNDFPTHIDILTASIAPENLRAVPTWQFTSTAIGANFLTSLNDPNPEWDVVRVQISLPISTGGGAFIYIPLRAFFYTVEKNTDCFAPLYFLNTLGGFDAVQVDCCQIEANFETNPTLTRTPRTWTQANSFERRSNPAQGGLGVQKNAIRTEYKITGIDWARYGKPYSVLAQLKQTKELYTNQNFFTEYPQRRGFDALYKLNIGKQSMVYRALRGALPDFELTVSPANEFRTQ